MAAMIGSGAERYQTNCLLGCTIARKQLDILISETSIRWMVTNRALLEMSALLGFPGSPKRVPGMWWAAWKERDDSANCD